MDFKNVLSLVWQSQLVLTTAQLAEFYGCESRHISDNFKRNEKRFKEGKHYFKLEGEALKQFKDWSAQNGLVGLVGLRATTLYLWTARGAARHAKMLSTDIAWEIFEELEDNYFNRNTSEILDAQTTQLIPAATVNKSAARRAAQLKPAHVYVALLKNKTGEFVKIGISNKPLKRIKAVKEQTESITCDFNLTSLMPREVSRFIEGLCKEKFSSRRIEGEFFSVNFAEMFDAIKMFTETVLVKMIDGENFAKLKSQVKLLTEPDEDFEELIYRGDLLAGENIFCMAIE